MNTKPNSMVFTNQRLNTLETLLLQGTISVASYTTTVHYYRFSPQMLIIYKLENNILDFDFDLAKTNHFYNSRGRDNIYFLSVNLKDQLGKN